MGAIAVVAGSYLSAGGFTTAFGLSLGFSLLQSEFGGAQGVSVETPAVARSEYGVPIPRVWGKHITLGNTVWAAPISRRDQKHGGFGQPKYTETTFYGTWLTLHCAGPLPGKTMRLNRLWALQGQTRVLLHNYNNDSPQEGYFVEYDEATGMGVGYWGGSPSDGTMRIYTGTDNQTVFPEIEAINGVGNTQAYVNRAGILLINFPLGGFGNQLPPLEAEWVEETTTVGELATDISTLIQNDDSDFAAATDCDFSALDADEFIGFKIDQRREARTDMEQIRRVFYCDFIDLDGKITAVKRGGASVATLTDEADLAYRDIGVEMPSTLDRTINQKGTIPDQVDVAFYDDDRDGKPNTQPAQRLTERTEAKDEIATSFRMKSSQARAVGEVYLAEQWIIGREPLSASTSWRKLRLAPTDVITVQRGDETEEFVIGGTQVRLFGPMDLTLQKYAALIYTQSWQGESAPIEGNGTLPTDPPLHVLFESVALHDGDTDLPGFYIVATQPYNNSWTDYRFMETSLLSTITAALQPNSIPRLSRGTIGTAVDVLPDWSGGSSELQTGEIVRVDLDYGTLVSVDEDDLLAGANTLVWGSAANGWEVLSFTEATPISGAAAGKQRYELSGAFWRGRRGSEPFIGTHQVGDQVVLINSAVERVNVALSDIGVSKSYAIRYSTTIETKSSLATMTHTTAGTSLEPLSPAYLEAVADGADIGITWEKRTRFEDVSLLTGVPPTDAPYDLTVFKLEIYNGSTLVRVLSDTLTVTNSTYAAAEIAADGFSSGDTITINCYQKSSVVGWGFAATTTVLAP